MPMRARALQSSCTPAEDWLIYDLKERNNL